MMTVIRTGIPQYMANLEAQRDIAIARAEAAEKKVAELESNLNAANERASRWEAAWEDIWDYAERKINQALLFYNKYRQEKKRVAELEKWIVQELDRRAELEEALASLLDGLDSNYDERCGLTGKEWEQRIFDAGLVLKREV